MKVAWGMMMTDGSGKLGGQVASKNRGGSYVRTKVKPSNPRTTAQTLARYTLTTFSKGWAALTQAQIAAWNAAVTSWIHSNVFGNKVTPTGKNLYCKLNINIALTGQTAITSPPTPGSVSQITAFSISACTPTTFTLAWTSGVIPAGEYWYIEATKCVSPGRSFVKNLYRNVTLLAPAVATGVSIFTAYNAKFGAPVIGDKVSVRIKQILSASGTPGLPLSTSFIVT